MKPAILCQNAVISYFKLALRQTPLHITHGSCLPLTSAVFRLAGWQCLDYDDKGFTDMPCSDRNAWWQGIFSLWVNTVSDAEICQDIHQPL